MSLRQRTVHLTISGKVQGVFFRASAKEKADALGINGWVKNTREGNVEILAGGNEDKMKQFIQWCHQGPRGAFVQKVTVKEVEEWDSDGFSVVG
ncbi:MAG: acylphosphatase [Bacteroidetes bacterium]|nr:MAG: acylphosphatase [Bacteroidota bacterium]